VLDRVDAQFILLGEGEAQYTSALAMRAVTAPESIGVQLDFSDRMEHLLLAGGDACLVPSVYELCGLTQMRAQRYGTLPVAHRVGGLADTIDEETGFLFAPHTSAALADAVERAVTAYAEESHWTARMRAAMRKDFGWAHPRPRIGRCTAAPASCRKRDIPRFEPRREPTGEFRAAFGIKQQRAVQARGPIEPCRHRVEWIVFFRRNVRDEKVGRTPPHERVRRHHDLQRDWKVSRVSEERCQRECPECPSGGSRVVSPAIVVACRTRAPLG
jgi:hypothetical protein